MHPTFATASWLLVAASLLAAAPRPAAADEAGDAVMRRVEATLRSPGEELNVRMTLTRPSGETEVRSLTMWMKSPQGKAAKTLVRFRSPGTIAGTALLTVQRVKGGQDNWLYVPALRQVRRVAPRDRSEPFMQSDFTIEDLTVRMDTEKRVYSVLGHAPCGERACTQIEDRPVDAAASKLSGYGWVVLHVDDQNGLVHRVDFYDKNEALLKVLNASGMEQVGDLWRFRSATVSNLQAGSKTEMRVTSRGSGARIDDSIFAPGALDAY